jgi:carbon starvation protein
MNKILKNLLWLSIALVGAGAVGGIALNRGESINAMWFVTAALCVYAIAYRFYSAWIATKVLLVDETRATPAERLDNGRDYVPTNRWVVFGHHFAAIAGPGPLIGPTLAAQFGYLPGTLWILIGAVLGGAVQDMVMLFLSTRRNGRSLGQMARDELGPIGGIAALIGTLAIMIILIAVLGLVVVNAMKHSPWATSTVVATIPIAVFIGLYMRNIRPGKVLEASMLGVVLLLLAVAGGGWIDHQPGLRAIFDHDGLPLALGVIVYGFAAAILPVWMLLAPRDYLSTFMKLGTIMLLAVAIIILQPEVKMPALTQFTDGSGPIFGGALFPFVFITVACGAISGFHALIASGTTPKLLANERDIRMIGYGSMLLESFVAIMAMIAATVLDPGVFFAINSPAGVVGRDAATAVATINSWGYAVTVEQMENLARQMGETTLFARTGGAPSLAVGMASIFSSALVVAGWGYFLYIGVIDPNGGVNILWPLFGIANQMLAAIALCVGTAILIKSGRLKYAWVTGLPLLWLVVVTTTAAWQKIASPDVRIGFFAAADDLSARLAAGVLTPEQAKVAPQLIFNQHLDAWLTMFFIAVLWIVILDMLRVSFRSLSGKPVSMVTETPYVPTRLGNV